MSRVASTKIACVVTAIFCTALTWQVVAATTNSAVAWKTLTASPGFGAVINGAIIVHSSSGIEAISTSNGTVLWNYTQEPAADTYIHGFVASPSAPSRAIAVTCYSGSSNISIFALDTATGHVAWNHTEADVPCLMVSNFQLFVSSDGKVTVVSPDESPHLFRWIAFETVSGRLIGRFSPEILPQFEQQVFQCSADVVCLAVSDGWPGHAVVFDATRGTLLWNSSSSSARILAFCSHSSMLIVEENFDSIVGIDSRTFTMKWRYAQSQLGDARCVDYTTPDGHVAEAVAVVAVFPNLTNVSVLNATTGAPKSVSQMPTTCVDGTRQPYGEIRPALPGQVAVVIVCADWVHGQNFAFWVTNGSFAWELGNFPFGISSVDANHFVAWNASHLSLLNAAITPVAEFNVAEPFTIWWAALARPQELAVFVGDEDDRDSGYVAALLF